MLVQNSRDDPGARILTAFTFASIVKTQVIEALQASLQLKLEDIRKELTDPVKREEVWMYGQAAWLLCMAYVPFVAVACGYTAWAARDVIFGQNADVADVVATLLIIHLISLLLALASTVMRTELGEHKELDSLAPPISWTVGLTFVYVLDIYGRARNHRIALTDIITHGIQFRLLVPRTSAFAEWPGWRLRAAIPLMQKVARHPTMHRILAVNLSMALFGFMSLLASLIEVDIVVEAT